jgi:hypothetical protein
MQALGLRPAVPLAAINQRRLRERLRRADLGFTSLLLPLGVAGFVAGALESVLGPALCFTGRVNGAPPGYQTV